VCIRPGVDVSGISPSTTKEHLREFFTFCGNISDIQHTDLTHATIYFSKAASVKTALMLDGGQLDGSTLHVTGDADHPHTDSPTQKEGHFEQADKPRAGIAAEYLAKGYVLKDDILKRAIEIDEKQGISKKFLNYLNQLDTTVGERTLGPEKTVSGKVQETVASAADQAKAIDQEKGITKTAYDYYAKALASPFGQKVLQFYTSTSKQVTDIHEEALRISAEHKAAAPKPDSPAASGPVPGTSAPAA